MGYSGRATNCAGSELSERNCADGDRGKRLVWVAAGVAVAQVGSLFSADAWNNIGFTAGEVKNPKRDVALSMAFGTIIVMTLYLLANLAYICALPLDQIQTHATTAWRPRRFLPFSARRARG